MRLRSFEELKKEIIQGLREDKYTQEWLREEGLELKDVKVIKKVKDLQFVIQEGLDDAVIIIEVKGK